MPENINTTADNSANNSAANAQNTAGTSAENQEELVEYSYSGKTTKLPKDLIDSLNKRTAAEKHQLKEKYTAVSEELNILKTQLEEVKLSQMSDKEKAELAEKKRLKELEDAKKAVSDKDAKFKNYYLDTELYKEAAAYDTYNAKQAINLLKAEYKHEFAEDENGDVQIVFNVNGNKVSVKEALKTFFSDPTNQNLLKSNLKSGAGTKQGTAAVTPQRTIFKRSEVAVTDSDAAKEYREAMKAGLKPSLID